MENIPFYISLGFGLTTFLTAFLLYKATRSRLLLIICLALLLVQAVLGISGFYTDTYSVPPRLLTLIGPPLIGIALLFILPSGRKLADSFDQKWMVWLSVIRVPVEIILVALSINKLIPQLMTFEGRNFDILSGLSAPFVAYYGYTKIKLSRNFLLIWNFICLGLLLNIVINAILSIPGPLQQLAFDQPNIAVLYFPFVWLPGFVVPAVLLSHLVNIRQLWKRDGLSSRHTIAIPSKNVVL